MQHSKTIMLNSYGNTKDELRKFLIALPEDVSIGVSHTEGDRPWDSRQYRLTASWTS